MSTTIIHLPSVEDITDTMTPSDLLACENGPGSSITFEMDPSYTEDEIAWLTSEFLRAVAERLPAVRIVHHAEQLEAHRVVTRDGTPVAVELGAEATARLVGAL